MKFPMFRRSSRIQKWRSKALKSLLRMMVQGRRRRRRPVILETAMALFAVAWVVGLGLLIARAGSSLSVQKPAGFESTVGP